MYETMTGSFSTPQEVEKTDARRKRFDNIEEKGDKKIKCLFIEFLQVFLKQASGVSSFGPLPSLVFDGKSVDLFTLFFVVREKGGFESVSRNGSWGSVAEECGFKLSIGVALRLVYNRYLYKLDQWLKGKGLDKPEELTGVFCGLSVELKSDLKLFFLGAMDKNKEDGGLMNEEAKIDPFGFRHSESFSKDQGLVDLNRNLKKREEVTDDKVKVKKILNNGSTESIGNSDKKKNVSDGRKRRRECYPSMLSWMHKVAKNPCNPEIGTLPERHKWKYYDNRQLWKQSLMVREARLWKRNNDPSSQQLIWQKKQKMHPSLYDDQSGSERLRCSRRLILPMNSSTKPMDSSTADSVRKRIPLGPLFQAELPKFWGEAYNSDCKWLGARIWPLEKGEVKSMLIEREPIGKGRQESCGCQFPGSVQCVRFHVGEKRMRLKLEVGSSFYAWKFDGMGEEVGLSWTEEEKHKFQDIIKVNISSLDKYFWDELFKAFPHKGRVSLVSYYYNVFLLQRRGCQNRISPHNIDSDDEESEFVPLRKRFGRIASNSGASIFVPERNLR